MPYRTTLMLDTKSRMAARELAVHYDCSTSEAIRRAVQRHRDQVLGLNAEVRRERKKLFVRLVDLFESNDAEAEIRRLKSEDAGF